VLAFSHAINQCQSLTHLKICFLEGYSLCALDLAALPQSCKGWSFVHQDTCLAPVSLELMRSKSWT
jgi:hypothetical protein